LPAHGRAPNNEKTFAAALRAENNFPHLVVFRRQTTGMRRSSLLELRIFGSQRRSWEKLNNSLLGLKPNKKMTFHRTRNELNDQKMGPASGPHRTRCNEQGKPIIPFQGCRVVDAMSADDRCPDKNAA
jgi:hypothetical protein